MLKIAILGFGLVGKELYNKLTNHPLYNTLFVVSKVQVKNTSHTNLLVSSNRGEFLSDNSFDTLIDCSPYNQETKELIFHSLARRIVLHTCSKELVWTHWEELLELAEISGSTIYFGSIPASPVPTEFDAVELTNKNFKEYSNKELYIYRAADANLTSEYIMRDLLRQIGHHGEATSNL